MMNNTLLSIGDKFYKTIDGNTIIIRIKRIINEKKYQVYIDNKPDKLFNISYDNLQEYTKLKPYGTLFFTIMQLQGKDNNDVSISFFRREDEGKLPFAVCRQQMEDVYMTRAQMLDKDNPQCLNIGVSISQETCPEEIPFEMTLACNSVLLSTRVSIYLDDRYNDIVNIIPKKDKYNKTLSNIYDKLKNSAIYGANSNIDDLIKNTGFMEDISRGFGIKLFGDQLLYNTESLELIPEHRKILEKELNVEMFRTYVVKYDYTININEIKRSYVLVRDITEDIYIVAYDKGEYINSDMRRDFRNKLDLNMTK